jgi:hypothetical protein
VNTVDNPFVVLGVPLSASMDDINAAWKEKVKKLHPDRFPEAPPEVLKKLNDEMARINACYQVLKEDLEYARRIFSESTTGNQHATSQQSASRSRSENRHRIPADACELCGSLHTADFSFTRQIGLIFQRRVGTISVRLCRNCAQTVGRDFQSRTLTTGWWGAISAPTNFFYVLKNAKELWRASQLDEPIAPRGFRTNPLDPGRPVWLRPFSWIGPIVIAIAIAVIPSDPPASSEPSDVPILWLVGNCVSGSSLVYPVSCNDVHSGRITASVGYQTLCPIGTDGYVTRGTETFCIDENQ